MSEEQTEGTSIKSILIGLVSTITIAVGGFITNKLTGEEEKEEAPKTEAPVINVNMTNNQTQTAGKTVIINKPQKQKTTPPPPDVQPKKTETEKRKEEGLDW